MIENKLDNIKERVVIIAEAGVNHNGDVKLAHTLVDLASECGADYIKFQTFNPKEIVTKSANLADYQTVTKYDSQLQMLQKLQLPISAYKEIIDHCKENNIGFISTPFDIESLNFLVGLDIPFIKVSSCDIDNIPLLRKIAQFKKPCILSSGLCELSDIELGINTLVSAGLNEKDIYVLHCTTEYPCPYDSINLRAINTIKNSFSHIGGVGISDHSEGICVPVAAVAMGARIVEKHFTIDKNLPGPDHKASLSLNELKEMIKQIRNIELALGSGIKQIEKAERKNRDIVRRSIVAGSSIKKGEILTEKNLKLKRPGTGLSASL